VGTIIVYNLSGNCKYEVGRGAEKEFVFFQLILKGFVRMHYGNSLFMSLYDMSARVPEMEISKMSPSYVLILFLRVIWAECNGPLIRTHITQTDMQVLPYFDDAISTSTRM